MPQISEHANNDLEKYGKALDKSVNDSSQIEERES
jgi:hypothetical protein